MRGVKPPQMDDSVCLLIARVSKGQVSHLGVRGCEGYWGSSERLSTLLSFMPDFREVFFVSFSLPQVHFTNNNSSAKAGKYSNRLTFKRHLKQMNQEKRVWVHFNCLFYYSILPGTVPLVLSLTWKKYSYCLMTSALFFYVICFFYTQQKKRCHMDVACKRGVWLIRRLSTAHQFDSYWLSAQTSFLRSLRLEAPLSRLLIWVYYEWMDLTFQSAH